MISSKLTPHKIEQSKLDLVVDLNYSIQVVSIQNPIFRSKKEYSQIWEIGISKSLQLTWKEDIKPKLVTNTVLFTLYPKTIKLIKKLFKRWNCGQLRLWNKTSTWSLKLQIHWTLKMLIYTASMPILLLSHSFLQWRK